MDIQKEIIRLVKRYGTSNPFELAEAMGIIIRKEELGHYYGFHNYACKQHFIHINWSLCYELQRYTCAHELGHAILHSRTNTSYLAKHTMFSVDRIEHQADEFAVRLLTYGMDPIEGMTLREASAIYGVLPDRAELLRAVV